MPELPDILLYLHALESRVVGKTIERLRIISPFVLRTFDPPTDAIEGKAILRLDRLGKRIVFDLEDDLFVVVHLMIAGRFRWTDKLGDKGPGKIALASFVLSSGTLHLVESSKEKRASIHVVRGRESLKAMDRRGLDVLGASLDDFTRILKSRNHTLKRSLTDPTLFDGIGNAYSDEILHAAKLSPLLTSARITPNQFRSLYEAVKLTLTFWTAKLQKEFKSKFPGPGDVTAFRPDFAVHGKFDQPCPVCGTKVQRIRYASNETNYCPRCQTNGKVLADRSMSQLLKDDWIADIDELEAQGQ